MKARFECNGRFLSLGEWQLSNPWPNKSANSSFSNCFRGNSKGLLKGFVVLFVSYKTDIWSVILHKHLLSITWGSIILIFSFFQIFLTKMRPSHHKMFLECNNQWEFSMIDNWPIRWQEIYVFVIPGPQNVSVPAINSNSIPINQDLTQLLKGFVNPQ